MREVAYIYGQGEKIFLYFGHDLVYLRLKKWSKNVRRSVNKISNCCFLFSELCVFAMPFMTFPINVILFFLTVSPWCIFP